MLLFTTSYSEWIGLGETTVLIVDDESAVTDVYAAHLQDEYDVRTAYSGSEALEELDDDVDAVLLDRRMPGMSGDEVLEHIREEGYDCRVAMVTAVDPDFDILDMGFDEYVVKPVSRDDLYETVEQLLTYSTYDDTFQEYFSLVSKRAALETSKSRSALETNEEYQELTDEIEELEANLDDAVGDLEEDEFGALFRMPEPDLDSMDSPSQP
ncbi:Response regulator receiver domain-containing protein [Halorientalis regularis]|uniref:Response regulator receiver domain-containing protein n=1 Tax=Halorientalis regularis TaxID=660518 RepID=A0A1G7HPS9_9EURY|nr:Response regulator receiver domain-containing protein [Halorientalis regularis]